MTLDARLLRVRILEILAAGALAAGCNRVEGEACLAVDMGAECPAPEEAEAQLKGDTTCSDPVEEVRAVHEFLEKRPLPIWDSADSGSDVSTEEELCCYSTTNKVHRGEACIEGRPLSVEGGFLSAAPVRRSGWADRAAPALEGLGEAERAALAEAWTRAGLVEHASVATFSRLALELLGHGAPPALVLGANLAAAEEIEHARAAFSIASAFAGAPVGPGALSVPARPLPELRTLALESFREGCVGETLATLLAAEQLARATDPAVKAALERVVADEARHAALAWAVLRWALAAGGEPVREALRAELAALRLPAEEAGETEIASHGLLGADRRRRAMEEGLRRVVRPAAEALLG